MIFDLFTSYVAAGVALGSAAPATAESTNFLPDLLTGTFSNEEQVYFAKDAGRIAPPWLSLKIEAEDEQYSLTEIDAFGREIGSNHANHENHENHTNRKLSVFLGKERATITLGDCSRFFDLADAGWTYSQRQNGKACQHSWQIDAVTKESLTLRLADGTRTILKRSRPVECWAAVLKREKKEDGRADWLFVQKLALHDQGGRVRFGGGDSGADEIVLRMRTVHWPLPSKNRPSMVLYIHKTNPDRAESYSWADIQASRLGINLRWMQASCTIVGAERDSDVTLDNFRG